MPRKTGRTLGKKELNERARSEDGPDDVIEQSIKDGTQIQAVKQLIASWGSNLSINDGIAIHTNFNHEEIEIFVGLMRSIRPTKNNLRKLENLEKVIDRFILSTTDIVEQLSERERRKS